jgi:hypothetical protein
MRTLSIVTTAMLVLFIATPNTVAQRRKTGIPLESTVSAALKYRVTVESNGALSVASFRKTNGYDSGNGLYVVEWQAEVLFEQEGYKAGNAIIGYWEDFRVLRQQPSNLDAIVVGNTIHFDKGVRVRLTGDSALRKTEQGWRSERLTVKTAEEIAGQPNTNGPPTATSPIYVAPDGKFSYRPPTGWVLLDHPASKYKVVVLRRSSAPFEPSINVSADFYEGTLDDYMAFIVRTLKNGATFVVLDKSDFTTDVNQRGIRVIGHIESGGKRFQLNIYVFGGKDDQKFLFTCSALAAEAETYDKIYAKSMKTFKTIL